MSKQQNKGSCCNGTKANSLPATKERAPTITSIGSMDFTSSKGRVGVVGTGNFAVAFTKSLVTSGFKVTMGSRRPKQRMATMPLDDCLCGVKLTTIDECLTTSDVIFIAIHMEDFQETLGVYQEESRGKILVDVSNREYRYAAHSNAEYLSTILPHAIVVKAFNSVPAQAFDPFSGTGRERFKVFVASDDQSGRDAVMEIAKTLGFLVIDLGQLKSSRFMEEQVLKTFTHWRIPLFLTFGIFNLWGFLVIYLAFIEKTTFSWEQMFLKVLNKPLCMTAITMLALTYLPGQLAAVLQVWRGTKHRRFPRLLDTWLKSRKQIGLIAYLLVVAHVIASVMMLSPTYYSSWFHQSSVTLPTNLTAGLELPVAKSWMTWKGEAACLVGLLAFLLLTLVALTSVPSIGDTLNWSEWTCVHSRLSYTVLFLAVAHVAVMGAPWWAKAPWKLYKSITFLSALLPSLVLLLKLAFSLPPLCGYLRKIRRGWERESCRVVEDIKMAAVRVEKNVLELKKSCHCGGGPTCETCSVNANCRCKTHKVLEIRSSLL